MNTQPNPHKRVLILDESVEFRQLEAVAAEAGWPLTGRFNQGFEVGTEIQWTVGTGTVLDYMEFQSDGVRLVAVRGEDAATVDEVAAAVTDAVATVDQGRLLDEILTEPSPDPLTLVRAWRSLIVACSHLPSGQPMDDRLLPALRATLRHPERQVRFRGFIVADKLGGRWPSLLEPVLERKDHETELDYMVEAFEQSVTATTE